MKPICPHCEDSISKVVITSLQGVVPGGRKWNCVAFLCPSCSKVLNTTIDPIALKTDTVSEVLHGMNAGG